MAYRSSKRAWTAVKVSGGGGGRPKLTGRRSLYCGSGREAKFFVAMAGVGAKAC